MARFHLDLARLLEQMGDRGAAEAHRTTAAALFRDLGMTSWLAAALERRPAL